MVSFSSEGNPMIFPRRSHFLSVLPVLFALLALAGSPLPATGDSSSNPTIRIGILAPLSGPFASGGSSFLQAATLAVERANEEGGILGRRVEMVVADSQGRVETAKSEALRLISREKVFAIVGAYLSEETIGAIEAAVATRKILIVPVAATAEITDGVRRDYPRYRYIFRISYSIPQWAEMMADFIRDRQAKTYAFVGAGIRWNRGLAEALKKSLGKEKAGEPAGILSGGERQMLVVGRALMGNPSLLLFDEPFLGLSYEVRDRILSVIENTLKGKVTILLAEHDLGAALRVLDRYCIFLNGDLLHTAVRSDITDEERLRAVFRRFYQSGATGDRPKSGTEDMRGDKR